MKQFHVWFRTKDRSDSTWVWAKTSRLAVKAAEEKWAKMYCIPIVVTSVYDSKGMVLYDNERNSRSK